MNVRVVLDKQYLVDRFNVVSSGCWEWNRGLTDDGYGAITNSGQSLRAHRVSFKLFNGYIDESLLVCHTCDNTICVNPKHLFQGTPQDNMTDKVNKNKQAKGTDFKRSHLTEDDVREIKHCGGSGVKVAERFGVHCSLVHQIRKNEIWKHVD